MLTNTLRGSSNTLNSYEGDAPQVMATSVLNGATVLNEHDEELGVIEEIMLDVADGRVAYAVLSYGGLLGMGDKLFAIPWSALKLDSETECFILEGVSPERLERSPGFDKDNWPTIADFSWSSEAHN